MKLNRVSIKGTNKNLTDDSNGIQHARMSLDTTKSNSKGVEISKPESKRSISIAISVAVKLAKLRVF